MQRADVGGEGGAQGAGERKVMSARAEPREQDALRQIALDGFGDRGDDQGVVKSGRCAPCCSRREPVGMSTTTSRLRASTSGQVRDERITALDQAPEAQDRDMARSLPEPDYVDPQAFDSAAIDTVLVVRVHRPIASALVQWDIKLRVDVFTPAGSLPRTSHLDPAYGSPSSRSQWRGRRGLRGGSFERWKVSARRRSGHRGTGPSALRRGA